MDMRLEKWWKNFEMGLEIEVAGAFIYNGIWHLHKINSLSQPSDTFEIMYNLSVGVERLQKIAIVLLEHKDGMDVEEFEESLITHNTMDLFNRIARHRPQDMSGVHKEFLSILSKFYKSYRYSRFSILSVPAIDAELKLFLHYIAKHLNLNIPEEDTQFGLPNDDRIRKFIGKVVKKICTSLFNIISVRARELNLYTYEIRHESKAGKVFLGKRLDFIYEDRIRREMLLFLMHPSSTSEHISLIRKYNPLPLDPGLTPGYIKYLINASPENSAYVSGEVIELYTEVEDVNERLQLLNIIDDEYHFYEDEEE